MKKIFTGKSGIFASLPLLAAMVMVLTGFAMPAAVSAQSLDQLPAVTMFYPDKNDQSPSLLKETSKAYIYFASGTKASSATAQLIQNGQVLGDVYYYNNAVRGATLTMDPNNAVNAALKNIKSGTFTLSFYELSYLQDDVEMHYSDRDHPYVEVTYKRGNPDGKVVKEEGISDPILSYYPADGDAGLMTFYFDRPIFGDDVYAEYQYGMGDKMILTRIPSQVAADCMSVSVDVRGKCYSSDVLAPGVTFYDDDGNPIPPPTVVTLIIRNLWCADGAPITYYTQSLDGRYGTTLTAQIYKNFNYLDLTFATPVILTAEFYSSTAPATKYSSINADTDMIVLNMENAEVIKTADLKLTIGGKSWTIPYAEIEINGNEYSAALPADVMALGSDNLIVEFDNVEYTQFDGADHQIKPLSFSQAMKEVLSITSLKTLPAGADVVLHTVDGITVTLANEQGYIFAEDDEAGIQLAVSDESAAFAQSTIVRGRLAGVYDGFGTFVVNPKASEYTVASTDVRLGAEVASLEALSSGAYDSRLVTIRNSAATPIAVDADGNIIVADALPVITDFIEGYQAPNRVENITGIYYNNEYIGLPVILLRSSDDINQDVIESITSIAEMKTIEPNVDVEFILTGAKVTYSNADYGFAIIEDAEAAIMVYNDDFSLFAEQGNVVTGTLYGYYDGYSGFVSYSSLSEITIEPTDVTYGSQMTFEQIADPANQYRLVTIYATEEMPIEPDGFGVTVGGVIAGVDQFDVLPFDFEMPAQVESFTGIIMPPAMIMSTDFDDFDDFDDWGQQTPMTLIAFRSPSDIVAHLSGINGIANDSSLKGNVYDLRGIKHNRKDMPKGIVIIDGRKYINR